MSSDTRIIKKYPNRRLYDTAISSYITLEDVKELVIDCVDFQVIDARSKEDITHATLLQIITEQEGSGDPIFTNEVLQNLIRNYGNSMQTMISSYLDQSIRLFLEQQSSLKEQFNNMMPSSPFSLLNDITKNNFELWESMQKNLQKSAGITPEKTATREKTDKSDLVEEQP